MESFGIETEGVLRSRVGYSLLSASAAVETDGLNGAVTQTSQAHSQSSEVGPSFLYSVSQQLASRHLLLRGPPKSGRSSLVFDVAYSMAASTPCRCRDPSSRCSCIAVTLFLPVQADQEAGRTFPLHCQPSSHDHSSDIQSLQDTRRSTPFSRHLLHRIRICWIATLPDLLKQLWTLQGAPPQEQPSCLLIDDLDKLCSLQTPQQNVSNGHRPDDGTKLRARQSLVLAALIDSANYLNMQRRRSGDLLGEQPVFVLAATEADLPPPGSKPATLAADPRPPTLGFPLASSSTCSHWKSLSIVPAPSSIHRSTSTGDNEVIATRWAILESSHNGHTAANVMNHAIASYDILQSLENGWRIEWTTPKSREE